MIDSEKWHEHLRTQGVEQDAALAGLRELLLKGLRAGLNGRAGADEGFIEDVCQVSLVRILEKLESFQGRSKFSTWVLSIALRIAFVELRRKHWKNVSLDGMQGESGEATVVEADSSESPYEGAVRNQYVEKVHTLIEEKLTEKQRVVLQCQLQGMPQDEIALKLDCSRNSIYKLCHDARKALRRSLEGEGYGIESFRETFNPANEGRGV